MSILISQRVPRFSILLFIVFIQACASTGKGNYSQSRLKELNNYDSQAQYTIFDKSDKSTVYTYEGEFYTRGRSGLQKRPFVKNIVTGKTKRGTDADKVFNMLRQLSPSQLRAEKLNGICSGESFNCMYDADLRQIYVFSASRKPLEVVRHSSSLFNNADATKKVFGNEIFEREYYSMLLSAVDENNAAEEERIIRELGPRLNLKKLFNYKKLDRHKSLYLAELRETATYDSYKTAFAISEESKDLDKLFSLRTGRMDGFLDLIDRLDRQSGSGSSNFSRSVAQYNKAPDIIAYREKVRLENEEKARLAELKRIEDEKKRIAEAKRKKEREIANAKRAAKLAREREAQRLAEEKRERERLAEDSRRRAEFQRNVGMGDSGYVCYKNTLNIFSWKFKPLAVRVESNGDSELLVRFYDSAFGIDYNSTRMVSRYDLHPNKDCTYLD